MTKMKDIAKQLGVSSATVSMVLNNRPGVRDETRRRVSEALRSAGYNVPASPLPSKQAANGSIHFIVYKKHGHIVGDTPFFSSLIEEIEGAAKEKGYNLQISYLAEDTLPQHIPRDAQGILLLATEMRSADMEPFLRLRTPIVTLDSALAGARVDKVLIDNFDGAFTAVKYLYEKGHRRIGYLCSAVQIKNFDERREGHNAALRDLGLAPNDFTVPLPPDTEGAYRAMLDYLKSGAMLPSAFVADFDVIAIGAMKALREMQIAIPEQVSIIGFDDIPFCTMTTPALTTIRVERECLGKVAIQRLISIMSGGRDFILKQQVSTTLIERDSVAAKI